MIGHALVKPELTGAQVMEGLELAKRYHLRRGAKEIDMVVVISKLLSREFQHVQVELLQMSELCHKKGAIFKIILETAYLTDELKIIACRSAARAEVDFVQTPTGFAPPDGTMEGAAGGGSSGVGSGVGERHAWPPMYSEYPNILDAGHRGVV